MIRVSKHLKIILLSSIIVFIYCIIYFHIPFKKDLETPFVGTIISIEEKDDYRKFVIKGRGKINCNYTGNLNFTVGDKVLLKGEFREYLSNSNIGLFNIKKFYYSKKIYHYINTEDILLIKKPNIIYKIRNKIERRINRIDTTGYLKVFILGSSVEDEAKDSFKNNGISHLFSISGMHVALFVLMLSFLFKKIKYKDIIIILFLILYLFISGAAISIQRATLLFILLKLNKKLKLKIKSIDILFFMFLSFLIYNPYNIYNVGFIFTFSITYGLMFFRNYIKGNYIKKIFKTSLIAFLISIPILINNFYQINLLSVIYNIIFVPFVSIIIFPLSILTFIFPILNSIFVFFINILENLSLFLSNIDSIIILKKMNYIFVILYYLVIYFTIKKNNFILIIVLIFIHYNINYFNKYSRISFIDVGQGDSILIELDHNKANILIDTGGMYKKDIAEYQTIPYLKSIGIKKLDYVIITHGDNDHIGELEYILNNMKVDNIIFNSGVNNDKELYIKNQYSNYNIINISKYNLKIAGYNFNFINDVNVEDENEDSLVIYTKMNNYNILLTGDSGIETETYLLKKYNIPELDILKVGHHGSKTSSSIEFINKLVPKVSIISVGLNNNFGHPNDCVIERLNDIGSNIYQTRYSGMIRITLKEELEIETAR